MSAKQALIVLTNYFPFYKGEEYFETELPILAKQFESIILIPLRVPKNAQQTRRLPGNVQLIKPAVAHSKSQSIKYLIKGITLFLKGKMKQQKTHEKLPLMKRLYELYFEGRFRLIYDELYPLLKDQLSNQDKLTTIYAYWFELPARVGVQIKEDFFKGQAIRVISRAHGYDLFEYTSPVKFLPERRYLMEKVDQVFSVSEFGANYLQQKMPLLKQKVGIARLGTTIIDWNLPLRTREPFIIVTCSTVRSIKRLPRLIDALNHLKIDFRWIHIGDGPQFKQVKQLAQQKLNAGSYQFLGHLKNDAVKQWYQNHPASLFVNVSESEGVPVSIMEALSVGLPVIATDVGGNSEIVQNNLNGIIIPKDFSTEELTQAIVRFASMSDDQYDKHVQCAYHYWQEHYHAEDNYQSFVETVLK